MSTMHGHMNIKFINEFYRRLCYEIHSFSKIHFTSTIGWRTEVIEPTVLGTLDGVDLHTGLKVTSIQFDSTD
jgi:dynactin complex subunit